MIPVNDKPHVSTDTVTLTRSQLDSILNLLQQIEGICLSESGQSRPSIEHRLTDNRTVGTNNLQTTLSTSHPNVAMVEPRVKSHENQSNRRKGGENDPCNLQQPIEQAKLHKKFTSDYNLPTMAAMTGPSPPSQSFDVFNRAYMSPRDFRRNILQHVDFSQVRQEQQQRSDTPTSSLHEFRNMTPSTSVPCFRRYQFREDPLEHEMKRQKMLEYQAMLDEQSKERERRKQEELERKRKEEELWEKRLQEQQDKIRREFEEEQRRQREREQMIERKRAAVIQAIERTSGGGRKRRSNPDTMSLMSVDAAIMEKRRDKDANDGQASKADQVKRAQSMYDVSMSSSQEEDHCSEMKKKQMSEVCVQTDYGLLLTWLFDMKEQKDWEAFLSRQKEEDQSRSSKSSRTRSSRGTSVPPPKTPTITVSRGPRQLSPEKIYPRRLGRQSASVDSANAPKSAAGRSKWNMSPTSPSSPIDSGKKKHVQLPPDITTKRTTTTKSSLKPTSQFYGTASTKSVAGRDRTSSLAGRRQLDQERKQRPGVNEGKGKGRNLILN